MKNLSPGPRYLLILPFIFVLAHAEIAQASFSSCVIGSAKTGHEFSPNCDGFYTTPDNQKWSFSTNDLGLVAVPKISPKAKQGRFRILVIGPSLLVNLSPTIGVVPQAEKYLRQKWKKIGSRFRDVEIVNGAESGFSIVQSHLRISTLMEHYQPDLVVFLQIFRGLALQQVDHHFTAPELDDSGLAKAIAPGRFWPLPPSWSPWIWKNFSRADRVMIVSSGIRLAYHKLAISLGMGKYKVEQELSPYAQIHLIYLRSLKKAIENKGAKLLVLDSEGANVNEKLSFAAQQAFNSWYKPEWIASKILPWPHLEASDSGKLYEKLNGEFELVDVKKSTKCGDKKSAKCGDSGIRYTGDYHLTPKGMEMVGKGYAEDLIPHLKRFFAEKSRAPRSK